MASAISVRVMPFFLRLLEVVGERAVGEALGDVVCDGDERAVAEGKEVVPAPYFAEEDVIVEAGELRGEFAEGVVPRGPDYFLLCHGCKSQC